MILKCAHCKQAIDDPLNGGALVWKIVIRETDAYNTDFRITHRSNRCIQIELEEHQIIQWRPISDFYINNEIDFSLFLVPRYDDEGNRIDWDATYNHDSMDYVFAMLSGALNKPQPLPDLPKRNFPTRQRANREGYVYLIESSTGNYKIGRTVNPDNRMATFSVKLPFEIEYTCLIKCDDMYQMERDLHNRFQHRHVNGEWFKLSPEDVNYIKGLAK